MSYNCVSGRVLAQNVLAKREENFGQENGNASIVRHRREVQCWKQLKMYLLLIQLPEQVKKNALNIFERKS